MGTPLIVPPTADTLNQQHAADDEGQAEESSLHDLGSSFMWALTLSACISGLLFGYDTGVISSTLVSIDSDLSQRPLTVLDKSLITSCTSLFALIASPVAGILADRFGRKWVIIVADVLFIVGALWQSMSSKVWEMVAGRGIVGLAVGGASLVTPLLFITGGQVIAYAVGWFLSSTEKGWKWMVGLGAAPAIIQLAIVLFLPETPRWLVKAGIENEAAKVLHKVYGKTTTVASRVRRVLRDIEMEISEEEETHKTLGVSGDQWSHQLRSRFSNLVGIGANRRALTIACMLQALQQLCGFNSLMYFSATIFSLLSFSSPTLAALSVAITNFLFTFLAFSQVDRIGRRRILLLSIPFMIISLFFCAAAFSYLQLPEAESPRPPQNRGLLLPGRGDDLVHQSTNSSRIAPMCILISLTIYTASYASGLGNVPWQQSELFPLDTRALGSAISTATNWGANTIVGLTFLPMMELISPGWTFVVYAVVCLVGWLAVWAIYPEMGGLGLEEVRGLLADGFGVEESLERKKRRVP
ncbi:hypothetical protein FQN54_002217 [Arachnomyces sp. PD_36]|nr:hypothetical protein FQN54_002217 [Arachnomyces sp. PD_36]